jgi:stress-induced morphogen
MADAALISKIHDVLKKGFFKDDADLVDVSDGYDDNIHVVVVSRKFDGRRESEKHDLIWSDLIAHLSPDEWGRITLSIGVSPEEIKASS